MTETKLMQLYEVDVHLGGGGDTDSIATYLVYAVDEEDAENTGIGQSGHLINAKANIIRNVGPIDEMDYDGVLMSESVRGIPFDNGGPGTDDPVHLLEREKDELEHTV